MGSASTPTVLRGLLVPDPRFRWDADLVTCTSQAGPLPGVPVAQDETELLLESVGSQAADTQLRYRTVRGGHPGDGATFVWRYNSDGSDDWRGWDPPVSISQGLEFISSSTTADRWRHPHAVPLADGTICVAVGKDKRQTVVWTRDPADGSWTEVEVYDPGSTYSTTEPHPCLVQLPSGRLLCFFWREWGGGSSVQLRMYYSDDSGATWAAGQKGCLPEAIDTTDYIPRRLRAAYLSGAISLVGQMEEQSGPEDQIWQWASNDLGTTVEKQSELTGSDRAYPDLIEHNGTLVVAYISGTASSGSSFPPWVRVIGSAYESLAEADFYAGQLDADTMQWGTQSGGIFNDGELALWADEDDRLWIMGRDHATGENEVMVRTSADGGVNWTDPGTGPAAPLGVATWRGRDADTYPQDFAVCSHRGRAMVAHRFGASPSGRGPSLCAFWLGGYTSVCMAQESASSPGPLTVGGFTHTWMPYDLPENVGNTIPVWTASTSTGASSLTDLGMRLLTTAGQAEWRDADNLAGTIAEGLTPLAEVRIVSGTGILDVQLGDSSPFRRNIEVRVTTTQIQVWDNEAGSETGAVSTTDADGAYVQIFVGMEGSSLKVWYRPVTASGDRKWTVVATDAATGGTAAVSTIRVRFGQGANSETYWRLVAFASDQYTEQGLYNQDNWSDLLGRSYMPTPVYVDGGTSVQAVDGPTFRNEDWRADTRYRYGVENVFPDVAATPRRHWRSVDDTAAVDIEVDFGSTISSLMGALAGVGLYDGNFGTAELHGQNNVGVWSVIATLDRRSQTGLYWGRSNRIIAPQTGGAAVPYYLPKNILAGSYFAMSDGGEGQKVKKIATNSPGTWTATNTSLPPRLLLEDIDGLTSTSGTAGEIWSKDSTHIIPLTTKYRKYRLRIPAQDTAEGYFKLGAMVFGHLFPLGAYLQQYGWGMERDWAVDWESVEGRTGARTIKALGPTRRGAEMAWVDGVNTHGLDTTSDPNWILGWTGGSAVAVPADVPWSLPGLLEHLQGAATPVAYLEGFNAPPDGSTAVHVTDRTVQLYSCAVSESLRFTNVVGDKESGQILRLGRCRLEEVV